MVSSGYDLLELEFTFPTDLNIMIVYKCIVNRMRGRLISIYFRKKRMFPRKTRKEGGSNRAGRGM